MEDRHPEHGTWDGIEGHRLRKEPLCSHCALTALDDQMSTLWDLDNNVDDGNFSDKESKIRLKPLRTIQEWLSRKIPELGNKKPNRYQELQSDVLPPDSIVDRWEQDPTLYTTPGTRTKTLRIVRKRYRPAIKDQMDNISMQGSCVDLRRSLDNALVSPSNINSQFFMGEAERAGTPGLIRNITTSRSHDSRQESRIESAKRMCNKCPIQGSCLRASLERAGKLPEDVSDTGPGSQLSQRERIRYQVEGRGHKDDFSIWGGATEQQRINMRRRIAHGLRTSNIIRPFNLIKFLSSSKTVEQRLEDKKDFLPEFPYDPQGKNIVVPPIFRTGLSSDELEQDIPSWDREIHDKEVKPIMEPQEELGS